MAIVKFILTFSLSVLAVQALPKAGNACTDKGGTCQDWRDQVCVAGYETGICPGDSNIRCCLPCDQTCQNNEAQWQANDDQCNAAGGTCMLNSNYCTGIYTSGKCGGPSNRQCCQEPAAGDCPRFISRAEWGARPPRSTVYIGENLPYQFVHHSDGSTCSDIDSCSSVVRGIQNFHMDDPDHMWSDIGYSFLVGGDGNIYEGRGWNVQGAHTYGYNSVGYGTCFLGNFMYDLPAEQAVNIYMQFLDCAVSSGKVSGSYGLYGHRQTGGTDCPGDALYAAIQGWPHWMPGSPSQREDENKNV